jgi:hypothetical protein
LPHADAAADRSAFGITPSQRRALEGIAVPFVGFAALPSSFRVTDVKVFGATGPAPGFSVRYSDGSQTVQIDGRTLLSSVARARVDRAADQAAAVRAIVAFAAFRERPLLAQTVPTAPRPVVPVPIAPVPPIQQPPVAIPAAPMPAAPMPAAPIPAAPIPAAPLPPEAHSSPEGAVPAVPRDKLLPMLPNGAVVTPAPKPRAPVTPATSWRPGPILPEPSSVTRFSPGLRMLVSSAFLGETELRQMYGHLECFQNFTPIRVVGWFQYSVTTCNVGPVPAARIVDSAVVVAP